VMQGFTSQFGDKLVANPGGVGFQLVSVPEPTSGTVIAVTGVLALRRRRRDNKRPLLPSLCRPM